MAANNSQGQGAAGSPAPVRPEDIRNVVLVGPSGSGKSTLFDHLIAARVPGRRAKEATKGEDTRSVGLDAASFDVGGTTINLLDTPGYPDFVGDLRAGLRAADAALFVVSAVDGVDAATGMLWHECEAVGMPRAIVVTKLEAGRGSFEDTVDSCRRGFGDAQPLYLPVQADDGTITGTLALLSRRHYDSSGGDVRISDATAEQREVIDEVRGDLVEAIITESDDDSLLDRYLEGEDVSFDTIRADLMTAVAAGTFFPAIPISALTGAGVPELLEIFTDAFPDPTRHPLPMVTSLDGEPIEPLVGDPDGPLVAEVVKTSTDPYVGRVSLVRVFNGTLRAEDVVHVAGHLSAFVGKEVEGHPDHDSDERVGQLATPLGGTEHAPKSSGFAVAGDLAIVARLAHAETGDTLSAKDSPCVVEPWLLPDPLLPVAIHPVSKADEDKLASALQRVVAEDVTMRLDHDAETHQTVLWTMGQAHVDVLLGRLQERYQVSVEAEPLRVALRETFVAPARAQGRHVKQSGGHGQFAVCHVGRASPVHPLGREGRPGADGQGHPGGLSHGRHPGHAHRRQGALRGLLGHGLPDRRGAGAQGGHELGHGHAARAGGLRRRRRGGRLRRARHERPVHASRAGRRHRARRRGTHRRARRGAGPRADALRHRPAVGLARDGHLPPRPAALRPAPAAAGGQGRHRLNAAAGASADPGLGADRGG